MSDVTRYAIGWREFSTYEDVHGQYVLATDYDRDTQALKREFEVVSQGQQKAINAADARNDAIRRRVEELEAHLGAHHKMPCATCDVKQAAIAQLTTRLAACREALKGWQHLWDMNELSPHYSSDGKLLDVVLEQTDKALAQEG